MIDSSYFLIILLMKVRNSRPLIKKEKGKNAEVESMTIIKRPLDHQVKVYSKEIQVT